MKNIYRVQRNSYILVLTFLISFLFPTKSIATPAGEEDVVIFVSCVEDLGNGTLLAHFGYDNPNTETVTVQAKKSYIAYNYTRDEKYVTNTFEPGLHDRAFSQEFVDDDWVRWTVKFPGRPDVQARADALSPSCVEALPIIPYYAPPEGGKVFESKIGAELTSLFETYSFDPAGFTGVSDDIYQLDGTKVLIEVVAENLQYSPMLSALDAFLFIVVTEEPSLNRATGWLEIADLLSLNEMVPLNYARPVYPGIGNFEVEATGLVNSQGDKAMRSDFARLGYDIDGAGVKIGVLSNSYNTLGKALEDVGNGDLPGATNPNEYFSEVQVIQDVPSSYGALSDEGRAMLQIIHDIAPGAELAFRTGYLGEQDMALGIQQLAAAGSDIIVDDITYITEPFFRDGVISQAIDQVVSDSVAFFSSAGNFGESSYMADFVSAPAPGVIPGEVHNFGGDDVFQSVQLPEGTYTLVLQWDDNSHVDMATTTVDLDLYLSNDEGTALLGFNRENIGGFPIEVIPFSVEGDTVLTNIVVSKAAGPNVPVKFKYIMFRGGSQFKILEHGQGTSTIVGHPNAAGAIAVGAVRYDKNPVYSPLDYVKPVIMSFSSVGGTPVNGVVRSKPDITAPNGVNTTVDLGNGDWADPIDPDTAYPNFFGTSAASPHAAAVAALIIEARSKFDPGHPLGPNGIRSLMRSTAMDMGPAGVDFVSGAGFLRADKAILTFANPYPLVENVIPDGGEPMPSESPDPLSFTVDGDYFIDDTQILFRGDTLTEGVMLQDDQTISVDHPGFLGNPLVQAFTPAISVSGLDGGVSDSVYFTDLIKQTVVVSANSAVKKYGEPVPDYSAEVVLITLDEDTLSLSEAVSNTLMSQAEADRFSGLSFTVPANDTSNAGEYLIQPALNPVYDEENPQTELDYAISEKYKLVYENSSLVVEKLALKITPVNVNMIYGQELPAEGFDFLYEITDSSVVVEDLGLVLAEVASEHTEALTNEISLVRGVALVNGIPMLRGTALVNGVKLLRGTALVNGVEVLVEVIGADTTVYVNGEVVTNGGPLARGVALVNDLPFVNMLDIRRGVALVNGNEVTFDDGYMTELNGEALTSAIPAVRGIALVNGGPSGRGIALVNGIEVIFENGITTIDGVTVPSAGIVEMNGIPAVRGVALVNSGNILRGTALVNGIELAIENGIPNVRGVALVNGIPTLRGIALVNGIPMFRGTALVNNLEVLVDEGEVTQVLENGSEILNGTALVNGVGFIRGTALVNGGALGRGTALVNGVALVNGSDYSDDVVNLENMNFLASGTALVNGLPSLRGVALVNGIDGIDGESLQTAAGTVQPDGSIVYPNVLVGPRGLALVNGFNFVRGTALVNGLPLIRGTALVNGSSINENSNTGTIMVFDATDTVAAQLDTVGFSPISFITGTTAGKHWIVPGTFLSNNFEISYGLGELNIEEAIVNVIADDKSKIYGDPDPELSSQKSELLGTDEWMGALSRVEGEDVGYYHILQGTLDAGENYQVDYTPDSLNITPASLIISADADNKVYDGSTLAIVELSATTVAEDVLDYSYSSANFDDKNVGDDKMVTVLGITVNGDNAGNYLANETAEATASISPAGITVSADPQTKTYGDPDPGLTYLADALIGSDGWMGQLDRAEGEDVSTYQILQGTLSAGDNYAITYIPANLVIIQAALTVSATAADKVYDGNRFASVEFSDDRVSGDILDIAYTSTLFADKNVGDDKNVSVEGISIDGDDAMNYTLANTQASALASITQKEVSVSPVESTLYIKEKDPLPLFAFIYNGWIAGDAGNEGYTVLREDGTAYDASSSTSAGTYVVTPVPLNDNYSYMLESGILYVNPAGPGTRAVKPILNCIEKISKNWEPDLYVANFEYENRNDVAVHIPQGPDNLLAGSGIDWEISDEVPTTFVPGGGSFRIFFDGSDLSWSVASRDQDQKVRNAANANSSSTKCKGNGNGKKAATVVSEIEEDLPGTAVLKAFPNPVVDRVNIELTGIEEYQLIQMYDLAGKSHPVTPVVTRSDRLEIDMTRLGSGHYIIRIIMEDRSEIVQIIKQ